MDLSLIKKIFITFSIIILVTQFVFMIEKDELDIIYQKTEQAYFNWNEDELNSILNDLMNIEEKGFDEFFLISKIFFRLAFIELEKNQGNYTKKIRNDSEEHDQKGLINLSVYYGEKAYIFNNECTKLNYYLAKGFQSLIYDENSYFKYKDKMEKYRKQNLKINSYNFYTLLFETYFHSIYSEKVGANRQKGKILQEKIEKTYPDNPETFNLLSSIAYDVYDYTRSEKYCKITLQMNPEHLEAQKRLEFLSFINKKPVINQIIIQDNGNIDEETIFKFIRIQSNEILTVDIIKKLKKDLERFSSISGVDIYYEKLEDNKVNLKLSISTETDKLIYISGGYEFIYNKDKMDQYKQYLEGIAPILFLYSHPNLFKKGLIEFNMLSVFGMQWDISMLCNFYEKIQFNFGISTWLIPFGNQFTDYSAQKENKAELTYLNLNPFIEIGKKFNDNKIEFFFTYSPNFVFMMPYDYPLNSIENHQDFIYPDNFFVEHKLGLRFQVDYISLLETGLVRKGLKLNSQVDWIKKTPDFIWGYKDYLNQPTYTSFLFYLYLEYSNYIKDIFYFSFGLHYKGGINLYKNQLISVNKGVIGVPFDSMMKIHGLNNNRFSAEHVLLFNSMYGFKVHNIFHLGLYFDGCTFFEKNADTYLCYFKNSPYYNNLIFGYGCFFKWIPYKLLVITLEASFSHEVGQNIIHGPVIGFHIQKVFINPGIKSKTK